MTSIFIINTKPNEFNEHLNLIKNYKGIYLSYGLHPCEVKSYDQLSDLNFEKLL